MAPSTGKLARCPGVLNNEMKQYTKIQASVGFELTEANICRAYSIVSVFAVVAKKVSHQLSCFNRLSIS